MCFFLVKSALSKFSSITAYQILESLIDVFLECPSNPLAKFSQTNVTVNCEKYQQETVNIIGNGYLLKYKNISEISSSSFAAIHTAQKMKLSIKETVDLLTFTEEILNRKRHFLCSVKTSS